MCWEGLCSDGPCYEHMNEKGIVALVSTDQCRDEEEEDEDGPSEIVNVSCFLCRSYGKIDDVLTWYRFQPGATASRVSWLVQLREVAAERREKKTGNKLHLVHFLKKNLLLIHKPFLNFTIFERSPLSSFLSFLIVYLHKLFDSFLQHWRNVHHF